jgi:deoxyribonuclease-4
MEGGTLVRTRLPLLGAQISTAGGLLPVPGRARVIGAEVVQVFASNPRMWRPRVPSEEELAGLVAGLRSYRLQLFLHSIYLINLATPDEELRSRSVDALARDLILGARVKAVGVVTHLGSHRGHGPERGTSRVTEAVTEAWNAAAASLTATFPDPETADPLPPLLLETGSGGGATLGGSLEEMTRILDGLDLSHVGVCLDTAHLFAAGYPLHEPAGLEGLVEQLRSLGLLERVGLMHLNDSSGAFASHRDHHANPGEGLIGYSGLARVVLHPAFVHIPFVLETPGTEGHGPDAANVAMVKRMREGKPQPRSLQRRPSQAGLKPAARGAAVPPAPPAPGA